MTAAIHASTPVVVKQWLTQVVGLTNVAFTLPAPEQWMGQTFVTIPQPGTIVGGGTEIYIPTRKPVVQLDCWGVAPAAAGATTASRKTPGGAANEVADKIYYATFLTSPDTPIVMPSAYTQVWIETIFPLSEVRWVPEPSRSMAHFSLDLEVHWIEREPVT